MPVWLPVGINVLFVVGNCAAPPGLIIDDGDGGGGEVSKREARDPFNGKYRGWLTAQCPRGNAQCRVIIASRVPQRVCLAFFKGERAGNRCKWTWSWWDCTCVCVMGVVRGEWVNCTWRFGEIKRSFVLECARNSQITPTSPTLYHAHFPHSWNQKIVYCEKQISLQPLLQKLKQISWELSRNFFPHYRGSSCACYIKISVVPIVAATAEAGRMFFAFFARKKFIKIFIRKFSRLPLIIIKVSSVPR